MKNKKINTHSKIVYEVYIKSFLDSNADGIGDINGIRNKLEYLKELGVTTLWLPPFYESPMVDEGFDVSNYYKVNPDFGTEKDIENLITEAGQLGLEILTDFVLNHTSSEHEWFQKALKGDEKYQKYYFFKDTPPTEWVGRFGGDCWEFVPEINKYYLHLYHKHQPDLNWDNPEVRKEMFNIVDFWLAKGITAYKFDVLYLISKPTYNNWKPSGKIHCVEAVKDGKYVHKYIRELMKKIKDKYPDTWSVGEMSYSSIEECINYTNPKNKEIDVLMNGAFLDVYNNGGVRSFFDKGEANKTSLIQNVSYWIETISSNKGNICYYLLNHDYPRPVNIFGNTGKYWKESSKMLFAQTIFMWGVPFLMQGDELGLKNPDYDNLDYFNDIKSIGMIKEGKENGKSNSEILNILNEFSRDNCRVPMPWNDKKNGGFTSGDPWQFMPKNYLDFTTVESQLKNPNSIFAFSKEAISIKKKYKSLNNGEISFNKNNKNVMDFTRSYEGEEIRVISNFTDREQLVKTMGDLGVLLNNYHDKKVINGEIKLYPYQVVVIKIK